MYLINLEKIKHRLAEDVSLVKSYARYVIYIDEDGFPLHMVERIEGYGLDILAVIGSAEVKGADYSEVLLMEIGMGRSKPYHQTNMPKSLQQEGQKKWIPKRLKAVFVKKEQLINLWPYIEDVLVSKAIKQMSNWKEHTRILPVSRARISQYQKKIFSGKDANTWKEIKTGVSFAASSEDENLIKIIILSSLVARKETLGKLAYEINQCLYRYKKNTYTKVQLNSFAESEAGGIKALVQHYASIKPEYIAHLFYKRKIQKQALFEQILEEFSLVNMDKVYSLLEIVGKAERLGLSFESADIWLPSRNKIDRDFLVFEVQPNIFFEDKEET